jgi:hypothetical protein
MEQGQQRRRLEEVRGGVDGTARQGTRQGRRRLEEEWMKWQGKARHKTGEEEVRGGVDGMAQGKAQDRGGGG